MALTFQNIPGNVRVPLFYGEVRPGLAGFQSNSTLLLIHLMDPAGTAIPDKVYTIFGNEDGLFGAASPVAQMIKTARANAPFQTIAAVGQAAVGGGSQGVGTVLFNAPATRAYTYAIYLGGKLVRCAMANGDTAAQQATKLAAACVAAQAAIQSPFTVAVDGVTPAKVNFTATLKGVFINDVRLETGLSIDDDTYATSISTVVQPVGGVGDTDITAVLAALADVQYDWIGLGYFDSANVGKLETFLDDISGRWSPYSQKYGHFLWSKSDTPGNLATLGLTRNSQHGTLRGQYKYATPSYIGVAALAGIAAAHLSGFPEGARPLQSLPMIGVIGPKDQADRFTVNTRQTLYYDGVSLDAFDDVGGVIVDRTLTTYRVNQYGSPDATFLDINTPAQVMYALRRFRADITQVYGRMALVDSNPFGIDSQITAEDIRKQIIHTYEKLVRDGCMENTELFAAVLEVERDPNDANRVNVSAKLDTVNQLRIVAMAAIVYLQLQGQNL